MRIGFHNALWAAPFGLGGIIATAYGTSNTAKAWIKWGAQSMTHPTGQIIGLALFLAYVFVLWLTSPKTDAPRLPEGQIHLGSGHNIQNVENLNIFQTLHQNTKTIREFIERHIHHKDLTAKTTPLAGLEAVLISAKSMEGGDAELQAREARQKLISDCRDIAHEYVTRGIDDGFRAFLERHRAYADIKRHLSEAFLDMLHKQRTFYVAQDGAGYPVLVSGFLGELERLEHDWRL